MRRRPSQKRRQPKDAVAGRLLQLNAVDAELAVGISVGDSVQYVASVDLSPADIRDLAAAGIAFNVAAYPTSDEGQQGTRPEDSPTFKVVY